LTKSKTPLRVFCLNMAHKSERKNSKTSLGNQERAFDRMEGIASENRRLNGDLPPPRSLDDIFTDIQLEIFNFGSNTSSLQRNSELFPNTCYQKNYSLSMFTENENKRYCQLINILNSEEFRSHFPQLKARTETEDIQRLLSRKPHSETSKGQKFSASHDIRTVNKEELSCSEKEDSVLKESILSKSFNGFTKGHSDIENKVQRSRSVDFSGFNSHKRKHSGIFSAMPKNHITYRSKSSISKELEKKLDKYRNNEMMKIALQEKVRKYKSEIKQELPKNYENMVLKNKRICVKLSPKKHQDLVHERAFVLSSRMLKAQERREKIVTEYKEQTKRKINLRNEQRLERKWKSAVGGYIEAWKTIICLVKIITFFTDMIEDIKLRQIEEEKRLIKEQMEKEEQELKERIKMKNFKG
jgi:hypothetical protein